MRGASSRSRNSAQTATQRQKDAKRLKSKTKPDKTSTQGTAPPRGRKQSRGQLQRRPIIVRQEANSCFVTVCRSHPQTALRCQLLHLGCNGRLAGQDCRHDPICRHRMPLQNIKPEDAALSYPTSLVETQAEAHSGRESYSFNASLTSASVSGSHSDCILPHCKSMSSLSPAVSKEARKAAGLKDAYGDTSFVTSFLSRQKSRNRRMVRSLLNAAMTSPRGRPSCLEMAESWPPMTRWT